MNAFSLPPFVAGSLRPAHVITISRYIANGRKILAGVVGVAFFDDRYAGGPALEERNELAGDRRRGHARRGAATEVAG